MVVMVGWDLGADRASNDADVSSIPPIIPYGGFSPVRLEGWRFGRRLPNASLSSSLLPAYADHVLVCFRPSCIPSYPRMSRSVSGRLRADAPPWRYWGKPAVRNDRGDRGDVGIIRSPVRASILPDCFRSKAVWGYDPEFMALMLAALGVAGEDIAAGDVWVATGADRQIAGVVALAPGDAPGALDLNKLFIEPPPYSQRR